MTRNNILFYCGLVQKFYHAPACINSTQARFVTNYRKFLHNTFVLKEQIPPRISNMIFAMTHTWFRSQICIHLSVLFVWYTSNIYSALHLCIYSIFMFISWTCIETQVRQSYLNAIMFNILSYFIHLLLLRITQPNSVLWMLIGAISAQNDFILMAKLSYIWNCNLVLLPYTVWKLNEYYID